MRAELSRKLSPAAASWLFPCRPGFACYHAARGEFASRSSGGAGTRLGALLPLRTAPRNEWVIAGFRTTTGKPISRQRPASELAAPILWYLARIVTPEGASRAPPCPARQSCCWAERIDRMGLHQRRHRHARSVRRDCRSRRIRAVPDPGRTQTVRDPRRDDPCRRPAPTSALHVRATRHGP